MPDRTLAETIAEGRRLIAASTPGPVGIWGEDDLPDHDDLCIAAFDVSAPGADEDGPSLFLCNVGSNGGARGPFAPVEAEANWPVSLANAQRLALGWNALPALLDVAEAAARYRTANDRSEGIAADTRNWGSKECEDAAIEVITQEGALDSALSKLRGVRT